MFVLRIIMSEVITNDDQEVRSETDPVNEPSATLRVGQPESEHTTMPNNSTPGPGPAPQQEYYPHHGMSLHRPNCRCRPCSANRAAPKKEVESITTVDEQRNDVLESPPPALAEMVLEENEQFVPGPSRLCIAEKSNQHDPECRCRECTYEANEHGWELVEGRLYTDDSPREEFCNLQELIDVCIELDEIAGGGSEN